MHGLFCELQNYIFFALNSVLFNAVAELFIESDVVLLLFFLFCFVQMFIIR